MGVSVAAGVGVALGGRVAASVAVGFTGVVAAGWNGVWIDKTGALAPGAVGGVAVFSLELACPVHPPTTRLISRTRTQNRWLPAERLRTNIRTRGSSH